MSRYRFMLDVESDERMTSTALRNLRESLYTYTRTVLLPKGNGSSASLAEQQTEHSIHIHKGADDRCGHCRAVAEDGLD